MTNSSLKQANLFKQVSFISTYSHDQAIADGVLVDISHLAERGNFKFHVLMTAAVHAECVSSPIAVKQAEKSGRLLASLRRSI